LENVYYINVTLMWLAAYYRCPTGNSLYWKTTFSFRRVLFEVSVSYVISKTVARLRQHSFTKKEMKFPRCARISTEIRGFTPWSQEW